MIQIWHNWLGMPKFDKAWHESDMADELAEYHAEKNIIKKWSEASDVVYTCSRSKWSGHTIPFPLSPLAFAAGFIYMFPKYTGRYLFFRTAGRKAGADKDIRCIRNPQKLYKLDEIISQQQIQVDTAKLKAICQKQLRYWPLLP